MSAALSWSANRDLPNPDLPNPDLPNPDLPNRDLPNRHLAILRLRRRRPALAPWLPAQPVRARRLHGLTMTRFQSRREASHAVGPASGWIGMAACVAAPVGGLLPAATAVRPASPPAQAGHSRARDRLRRDRQKDGALS
jgi:hypothetical protein